MGEVRARRPRFEWVYAGPPADFDLVVLDEALDEVHRQPAPARLFVADDALVRALAGGRRFHWFVEATFRGRRLSSAPAAFSFSH